MASAEKEGIEDLTKFAMKTARGLGEEALSYYGKGNHSIKFDEELVTTAELHLTNIFQDRLSKKFPEHQLLDSIQESASLFWALEKNKASILALKKTVNQLGIWAKLPQC